MKNTGYVEPDYTGNLRDHKIDLAWHQVTVESANSTFPGVMSGVTGVNVISPTWYSLYDNTGVVDGIASPSYVQQAHALGLEVWALIDDLRIVRITALTRRKFYLIRVGGLRLSRF